MTKDHETIQITSTVSTIPMNLIEFIEVNDDNYEITIMSGDTLIFPTSKELIPRGGVNKPYILEIR